MKNLIFTFIAYSLFISLSAQSFRYTNSIFQNVNVTPNVVYANAPKLNAGLFLTYNNESSTIIVDLKMDLHSPAGDTSSLRPAIIFVHGGAFLLGNKNHDDMVAFCDYFALKGYVTATIEYRLGMNILDNASTMRAVYRGLQDGRAAVRFLRENAATYGIDPTRIYMLGSSAGGFIALQNIYMNDPSEKPIEAWSYQFNDPLDLFPPFSQLTAPDLGAYDIGNFLDKNGKPDAVVSLWGAIKHPDLITVEDISPVLLIHGTNDATVPFGIGYPFNVPIFPAAYGSFEINKKLDTLNFTNKETYFVIDEGHEFYGVFNGNWSNGIGGNAYWDTIVEKATKFFYRQHKPQADFISTSNYLVIDFTNSSLGATEFLWGFGDGQTSTDENPQHNYSQVGTYEVKLYIENEINSWDTVSYQIVASSPPIYTTTFMVRDGNIGISDASISINNQILISDLNGNVSINLEDGSYPYTVSATGFESKTDTLEVNGATQAIVVVLSEIPAPTYQCTFSITDGTNVITGANISISNQFLISDMNGDANIDLEDGNYPYIVSANGFESKIDTLMIDGAAKTVNITLMIITAVDGLENELLNIYPNPASEVIHIDIPKNYGSFNFQVIDMSGKMILSRTDLRNKMLIDVSDYKSGIYFIILQDGDKQYTYKFIVK